MSFNPYNNNLVNWTLSPFYQQGTWDSERGEQFSCRLRWVRWDRASAPGLASKASALLVGTGLSVQRCQWGSPVLFPLTWEKLLEEIRILIKWTEDNMIISLGMEGEWRRTLKGPNGDYSLKICCIWPPNFLIDCQEILHKYSDFPLFYV